MRRGCIGCYLPGLRGAGSDYARVAVVQNEYCTVIGEQYAACTDGLIVVPERMELRVIHRDAGACQHRLTGGGDRQRARLLVERLRAVDRTAAHRI